MTGNRVVLLKVVTVAALCLTAHLGLAAKPNPRAAGPVPRPDKPDFSAVRLAITDLIETFGDKYPRGREYLRRLEIAGLERESRITIPLEIPYDELAA